MFSAFRIWATMESCCEVAFRHLPKALVEKFIFRSELVRIQQVSWANHWPIELSLIRIYFSICLTNTHHVGIDFQLFALSTILVKVLWNWPRRGLQIIIALAVLSTFARFYVTVAHELSIHIFFGISLAKIAEVIKSFA